MYLLVLRSNPSFAQRLRDVRQCVSDCVKILAVRTVSLASHSHRFCPADIGTSVTHLKVLMCFAIVIVSMTIRSRTLDATEPLHKRIDSLVVAHQGFRSAAAPATDDASFLPSGGGGRAGSKSRALQWRSTIP